MPGANRRLPAMSATLIGYARCSTDTQDLTAQRDRLRELGVAEDRIYLDHGLTGTSRKRPGLDQALAAILAAAIAGASFVGNQSNGASLGMALATFCYLAAVFSLR